MESIKLNLIRFNQMNIDLKYTMIHITYKSVDMNHNNLIRQNQYCNEKEIIVKSMLKI